jgi:hypothetical protein
VRYLVKFSPESLSDVGGLSDREGIYLSPEGDAGWAILEEDGEQSIGDSLGVDAEEAQPLLSAREYVAVRDAREELEQAKGRFVDDPSGALQEARRSVGRALEARGYPPPDRAGEATGSRREILQEYQQTEPDGADEGSMREAFSSLSDILERSARA